MSQGAAGSDLTFPYADRGGKLTDLDSCMVTPCHALGTLCGWVFNRQGPRKSLSGAVLVAAQ